MIVLIIFKRMEITKIKVQIVIVHLWEVVINLIYKILKFIKINAKIKFKINLKTIKVMKIKFIMVIVNFMEIRINKIFQIKEYKNRNQNINKHHL
jgi:hypothetical protein